MTADGEKSGEKKVEPGLEPEAAGTTAEAQTEPGGSVPSGSLLTVAEPKGSIDTIPVVGFMWNLYRSYSRRNGPLLSAGIAYYALFSMGPLLLLTMQITGRLFGGGLASATERLTAVLSEYLGEQMAAAVAGTVAAVKSPAGYELAIVGLAILLYGATRLFVRLQVSFNIMWDVRVVSREFSRRRLLSRLLVFGMILIPTLLLAVAVVLGTALSWLSHLLDKSGIIISVAQVAIPFVICWLALLAIFVILPDIHLRVRDCWFTTLLVAIAFMVATRIFGRYLSWSGNAKYAGAVGALVGVIFWVDIMAIITLVGVRFNRAIYVWRGKKIQPYYFAAPVTELPDAGTLPPRASTEPATEERSVSTADHEADKGVGGGSDDGPPGPH